MTSGELPFNWVNVELGDVSDACLGKMLDQAKHRSGMSLPYLRNINVRWGYFDLDDVAEMYFDESELEKYALYPGDLMVCEGGEPGRCAIWRQEGSPIKFQKALHRVRPHACLLPEWAMYSLLTDALSQRLAEYFTGTTIKHLTGRSLARYQILLPPLNEQRRIVAKLEELFARTRKVRQTLESIPPLLEKLRQSILAAAFRGDLTAEWRARVSKIESASELIERTSEPPASSTGRAATSALRPGRFAISVGMPSTSAPDGWCWVPLSRVAKMESGHTPSRSVPGYWNGAIPWLSIPDAREHHGKVILDTAQHVSEEGLANSSARLLPARAVCLSRTASVGYVTIMGVNMATSQDFANWVCTPAILPEFLMYALIAEGDGIRGFGEGSTHTTIYFPELKALHVCLAPIDEQREIVRLVRESLNQIEKVETILAKQAEQLDQLEQSILAKAFRGELVPQDPNDEPASVLLERIRAERAAVEPAKRGRKAKAAAGDDTSAAPKRRGRPKKVAAVVEPAFADQELPETGMDEIARQLQELERQEALLKAALEAKQ